MNLRKIEGYSIGLDIGTASVGWAAIDETGELCHFKGKPTWGSRLFPEATSAASTRVTRGQRRRYDRRRQRLDLLQSFFEDEVRMVDPDFFIRLQQSRLLKEDRKEGHVDYHWPLFNDSDFTERDYYAKYPTIYHLRAYLSEAEEKADIRLVYLAFHNIVKTRGNFLHQDNPGLTAKNANMKDSIDRLCIALEEWCANADISCDIKKSGLIALIEDPAITKREKQEKACPLLGFDKEGEKQLGKPISQAVVGYVADFGSIFQVEAETPKFSLGNEDKVDEFMAVCPDEGVELFEAIQAVYSSFVLQGILKGADGRTISFCKKAEYEQYGSDLRVLKRLARAYAPERYAEFFRGAVYEGTTIYNPEKAKGYTKYDSNRQTAYGDFKKEVEKLFEGTAATRDPDYLKMIEAFGEETFLRRLKTSDNGSIPYQLHLEEMCMIIERQAVYYPFLKQHKEKIESLVTFRIPYYVGPLTQKNAATDAAGNNRFAWAERKPGMENAKVFPWNWEEVIDKQKSAQHFIERMTGTCTYLQGEPVLPKCSLLYERFCVLNELNGARWTQDGDDFRRFDYADRQAVVDELFSRQRSVSYQHVEDWLRRTGHACVHVRGGQGERGFESKLSSYIFFTKDVLNTDSLSPDDEKMVEDLILWNTLFEDRDILKESIKNEYGDRLSADQIKKVCKKRFTGWGRLSKELLAGIAVDTDEGPKTVMDVLEEGSPLAGQGRKALVLQQVLTDGDLGFAAQIDGFNARHAKAEGGLKLEELPGSPALRRSINQSLRIVDEIVRIAGKTPKDIFVEVTRDEDPKKKGKRTKRRYDQIREALKAFKDANPDVIRELGGKKPDELDEKLTLYFMQNGRSLYSDKPIAIERLVVSDYCQVDHIIPQAYVKDDSFENKALVLSGENQSKSDAMLLDATVRQKMKATWTALHDAKLMGDKKYNNLMRDHISEKQMHGFIARQLVETSQVVKLVQLMLAERFPETNVLPIKAGVSSELRAAKGYVKCREANDYHHAHDALLACEIGRFVRYRHSDMFDNPMRYAAAIKQYVRHQSEQNRHGRMPGSAGFVVSSFTTSGFDKETGEVFKDAWDAEFECERIRRFLNYKDCFISRMPEETSGKFWKATIYSPRLKPSLSLPIKDNLPVEKYGGYSDEQFAHFLLFEAFDKKGRTICDIAPVPVSLKGECSLDRYVASYAKSKGLKLKTISRCRILKKQMLEKNGVRMYVTALDAAKCAFQMAWSQEEMLQICSLAKEEELPYFVSQNLYDRIMSMMKDKGGKLAAELSLTERRNAFASLGEDDRRKVLLSILSVINDPCVGNIDLKLIGGAAHACQQKVNYRSLLSSGDAPVFLVDQSVTGMFERRQRIGL